MVACTSGAPAHSRIPPTIGAMPDHVERRAVTVPDLVGLPFDAGRDLAMKAGVTLANPDPDGPPIAALAWPGPGLYYITRQNPAPGAQLREWDSVGVEIIKHGDAPDRELAVLPPSLPADSAYAAPEPQEYVDLTDD